MLNFGGGSIPAISYVFYKSGHYPIFCGAFEKYDLAQDYIKAYVKRNANPRIKLCENDFFIEAYPLGAWILKDMEDGNT